MNKKKLRAPFFVLNPKAYVFGDDIVEMATYIDRLAKEYDVDVLFTAQTIDIPAVVEVSSHLVITAQHMDGIVPGKGMGHVLPEALKKRGVDAVFLNHAEHPMSMHELASAMQRAKEVGMLTIVCADTVQEARAIAMLEPDVMVCEPTSLIGTGKASDATYMEATNEAVKKVSPKTQVLQAAGISTGQNVYDAIMCGADGTGGTSGIVCSNDWRKTLDEMLTFLAKAKKECGRFK